MADVDNVEVKPFYTNWALALMSQGIIVRLKISRWRAECRLSAEDLGLRFVDENSVDFMRRYVKLGKQKLLPPEVIRELSTIERKARDLLIEYSFDTIWGRFVPHSAFEEWKIENEVIKNDFMQAAVMMGRRYDELVAEVKEDYRSLAKDVWARLYPESSEDPTESFIENFVTRIVNNIPSRENVVSSFKYDTTYFIIPMPSIIEEDLAKASEVRRERQEKEEEARLANQTREIIAAEYVQRKRELIDSFLESTVVNMRQQVSKLCDSILKSIGKRKSVNRVSLGHIEKLKSIIKQIRLLNFYDDKEIAGLMDSLESEISKFKGERDDDVIVDKLKQIVEIGEQELEFDNFNPAISYLEV